MASQTKVFTAPIPSTLAKKEEYYKLTLEALEDVRVGRTIDDTQVESWIKNL